MLRNAVPHYVTKKTCCDVSGSHLRNVSQGNHRGCFLLSCVHVYFYIILKKALCATASYFAVVCFYVEENLSLPCFSESGILTLSCPWIRQSWMCLAVLDDMSVWIHKCALWPAIVELLYVHVLFLFALLFIKQQLVVSGIVAFSQLCYRR